MNKETGVLSSHSTHEILERYYVNLTFFYENRRVSTENFNLWNLIRHSFSSFLELRSEEYFKV
jgi:hypothetical protein